MFFRVIPSALQQRALSMEQTGGGRGMFIRLWRLGPEQSVALFPCWGGICVSGLEHTSLSPFTARLTYPSCTCLPSNTAQTVCEWGSFSTRLASLPLPPALIPPNKHCTGNCRDIWDFWGVPVERRRGLEQGCSLWHLGGVGRAKTQKEEGGGGGGIQRGGRDLALGGLVGWGGHHQ